MKTVNLFYNPLLGVFGIVTVALNGYVLVETEGFSKVKNIYNYMDILQGFEFIGEWREA